MQHNMVQRQKPIEGEAEGASSHFSKIQRVFGGVVSAVYSYIFFNCKNCTYFYFCVMF